MQRSLLAVFFLVFLSFVSVPSSALTPDDGLLFLEGVLLGIEVEVGNLTACTQDVDLSFTDFENGFAEIESGLEHLDIKEVEEGIEDFGAGVEEIAVALNNCGVPELVADLEAIAKDLSSGASGIITLIEHEIISIFHHASNITTEFKDSISYWKAGEYQQSGEAVGEIVGILLVKVKLN